LDDLDGRVETADRLDRDALTTTLRKSWTRQLDVSIPATFKNRVIANSTFVFLVVDHLQQRFDVFEFFSALHGTGDHFTRFGFGVS